MLNCGDFINLIDIQWNIDQISNFVVQGTDFSSRRLFLDILTTRQNSSPGVWELHTVAQSIGRSRFGYLDSPLAAERASRNERDRPAAGILQGPNTERFPCAHIIDRQTGDFKSEISLRTMQR